MNRSLPSATAASIALVLMSANAALAADACPHIAAGASHAGLASLAPAPTDPTDPRVEMRGMPGNKFPLPVASTEGAGADAMSRRTGTLAIRAVQGTPGGPPIIDAAVEVQLYHRGMLVESIQTRLDAHGVVMLEDLPLAMDVQPIVLVTHADLVYQKVGAVMDRRNPEQSIEVTCYEVTDEEPLWKVRMRHVMVSSAPDGSDGLHVTEVMMVENPGDRTWAGTLRPSLDRPVTTAFILPDGAMGVSLGRGFHDWCCTTLDEQSGTSARYGSRHALLNHLPIMPGSTEMIFSYIVPARRGIADIDITAPAAPGGVDHLMVLVPDGLETSSVEGLHASGTDMMGEKAVRRFMAAGLGSGDRVALRVAGLSSSGDSAVATAEFAKAAAGIGVIALLIGAVWMIFIRPAKSRTAEATDEDPDHQPGTLAGGSA